MEERISYVVGLYQFLNPVAEVSASTMINNTSIAKLCETDGGPYQRIVSWLEKKVDEKKEAELEVYASERSTKKPSKYRSFLLKEQEVQTDMSRAENEFQKCFDLMKSRNEKYGDSYKVLTLQSIANLIEMKMHRIANMDSKNIDPKIEDEFIDAANYAIFGLIKLKK